MTTQESTPVFDKKDQLEKITGQLLTNEKVLAVYDLKGSGSGFVGITSWRVIVMDKSFAWQARKKTALVSVPYRSIVSVASENDGGFVFKSSVLTIITPNEKYELEFRSNDRAHTAYGLILTRALVYTGCTVS